MKASQRDLFITGLQFASGLMMAQQIAGKAARDGLFLLYEGPRALPGMIAGAAAFSILLSLLSGRLMQRLGPRRVVPWALGVSGALQIMEWWLLGVRPGLASIVIYLHMAGFGVVLLSAFWSVLNEEFDPREAKRNFGRIAAGGIAGGLAGGVIAERTVAWSGAPLLMLILAGLHIACGVFLAVLMNRWAAGPAHTGPASGPPVRVAPHRSSLLRTLAAVVLLGSVGAALVDYVFKVYATATWGGGSDLVRVFAGFHTGVALLSFLLQSAGSKVFLEKFGLEKTILTLPATLAAGSTLALMIPGVMMAAIARAAEAAVRGSLFRAGYETCYTPIPAAEKRLAKNFIDVGSERGGDAVGAAIVYACLSLAGPLASPWILSIAALVGLCSVILCRTLDRIYIKALADSLESRAVQLPTESDMDLTTRSLVLRVPSARSLRLPLAAEANSTGIFRADSTLQRLSALRSSDLLQVHAALTKGDVSDPLIATQVCLLLGRDEHALLAHTALVPAASKLIGLLTDLMLDASLDVSMRRRVPRIIATVPGQRAVEALLAGLNDGRFEVRLQCSRALVKAFAREPRPSVQPSRILSAVDRELTIGSVLWESQRKQQQDAGGFGPEWLDGLLREKAHASLEYVFALLSLIHDRTPLMAAFRSLHLEDRHLRGTALEYLEGILPPNTREKLWDILEERPSKSGSRESGEILQDLLKSSETVVLKLRKTAGS
jgi:ATP/ADP translocase